MVFLKNKKGSIIIGSEENEWDDEGSINKVVVKDQKGQEILDLEMCLSEGSKISCGVDMATYIPGNSDMEIIKNIIDGMVATKEEKKEALKKLFRKMFSSTSCRFILFSDNKDKGRSIFHKLLDDVCEVKTGWGINPNSHNQIKVWTYRKIR